MSDGLRNRIGPRSTAHCTSGVFGASLQELSITGELGLSSCPWVAFAVCSVGFARTSTPQNVPKPSSSRKPPRKKAARRNETPRSKKADRQEDFFFMDRMESRLVKPHS